MTNEQICQVLETTEILLGQISAGVRDWMFHMGNRRSSQFRWNFNYVEESTYIACLTCVRQARQASSGLVRNYMLGASFKTMTGGE